MRTAISFTVIVTSVALVLIVGSSARGQTTTLFSVAPGGPSMLGSELIFSPGPVLEGGGPEMGLVPGDDIDGFSEPVLLSVFPLLFSVDPESTGDPAKTTIPGFPPNVTDEALVVPGQVGGDIFSSTEFFASSGIISGPPSLGLFNNFQVSNQDELGLMTGNGGSEDDVNGGGRALVDSSSGSVIVPSLFFTLSATSPSLPNLPSATPSGADIFFDECPALGCPLIDDQNLFASAATLGLLPGDDMDSLIVSDPDGNGVFSSGDQILFSLARGSPSFSDPSSAIFGRSPGDVFTVIFSSPLAVGPISPTLFAASTELGLLLPGDPNDNLDALLLPEPSSIALFAFGSLILAAGRRQRRLS